jgi:hypothetical protein
MLCLRVPVKGGFPANVGLSSFVLEVDEGLIEVAYETGRQPVISRPSVLGGR